MKILAVNCGSSSLKFQMYEMPEEKVLISGNFERIGIDNSFYSYNYNLLFLFHHRKIILLHNDYKTKHFHHFQNLLHILGILKL